MVKHESTLLTGATGFVGGQLLARMIQREDRQITCLVRAADAEEARARGRDALTQALGRAPRAAEARRVTWLLADLEERRLGLDPHSWQRLAGQTREIFHCAASVRFDLSLAEAQRINVEGVRHLLELAGEAGHDFRRFHHVSTAYVAGTCKGRVRADFLPSDRARNFRYSYERTKARAERLLRDQDRVPVTIYRPSIVAGHSRTGRTTSWNVLYVPMREIARGQLPFLRCGGRALVDSVGIDFAADGILALAKRPAPRIAAYHLAVGRGAFDVRAFTAASVAATRARGSWTATRNVNPFVWWVQTRSLALLAHAPRAFEAARRLGQKARCGLRSFEPYVPYTSVGVEFDADEETQWLAERGIAMPPAHDYLQTIVGYALETGFGRSAVAAEPSPTESRRSHRPRKRPGWVRPAVGSSA